MKDFFSDFNIMNSLSVYIAEVKSVSDDFANDGILIVDLDGLGEESSYKKAKASLTLRTAFKAWKEPPAIKFKGSLKGKGRVTLPMATFSNVTISAGTITSPTGPCPPPFVLSQGVGKIEDSSGAEIDVNTSSFDIELTSDAKSQLPWMSGLSKDNFIEPGDFVIVVAISNSRDQLYAVDVVEK